MSDCGRACLFFYIGLSVLPWEILSEHVCLSVCLSSCLSLVILLCNCTLGDQLRWAFAFLIARQSVRQFLIIRQPVTVLFAVIFVIQLVILQNWLNKLIDWLISTSVAYWRPLMACFRLLHDDDDDGVHGCM